MQHLFIDAIPASLVKFFARPYVAGDSLDKAIDTAARLYKRNMLTTLDLLAEGIDSEEIVARNVQTYQQMVDRAAKDERFPTPETRPTVSLKASSYTISPLEKGGDAVGSREAVEQICSYAKERNIQLTVDMESSAWTDFTLDLVRDLHDRGHAHVGAVIQTRLFRSRQDLDRLPPNCRVRLVIGIYQEPAEIALTNKREMKEQMLAFAQELFARGHYVEFATHDEEYVRRFVDEVAEGISPERFELQMLYGVPRRALQKEMAERGIRTRLYVPFALGWPMAIAYLRRRLDEYPAMMFSVLRDLLNRPLTRNHASTT